MDNSAFYEHASRPSLNIGQGGSRDRGSYTAINHHYLLDYLYPQIRSYCQDDGPALTADNAATTSFTLKSWRRSRRRIVTVSPLWAHNSGSEALE